MQRMSLFFTHAWIDVLVQTWRSVNSSLKICSRWSLYKGIFGVWVFSSVTYLQCSDAWALDEPRPRRFRVPRGTWRNTGRIVTSLASYELGLESKILFSSVMSLWRRGTLLPSSHMHMYVYTHTHTNTTHTPPPPPPHTHHPNSVFQR